MMKKLKIIATLAVVATMSVGGAIALTGCNNHEHSYTEWKYDNANHWLECPDDGKKDESTYGEHAFDGDADTTCNGGCGYVREVQGNPDAETGTLSGTVTAYGKGLSGVKVTIGTNDTVTGATGKYSLGNVQIKDNVTVTFTKDNYTTVTKTINASDWTEKTAALDAIMTLAEEKTTVSGVVKAGGQVLNGAVVQLGDKETLTGPNGAYSVEVDSSKDAELTLTVTHLYCEDYSETITITAGSATVTKDVNLTSKTVSELGGISLVELNAGLPVVAKDYNFINSGKGDWRVNSDSYNMAGEGILFHEAGQDIASGSTELKLYAYQRFAFEGMQQITVSATRFGDPTHNANLQGGGYPEVYVLLVANDGTVIAPKEAPGKVEKTHSAFNDLEFTFDEELTGVYTLAVGTTRGNRVAIKSVEFRGEEVTGTITGTVKQGGAGLAGADVTFGSATVKTDASGAFSINVTVRKGGSYNLTVTSDGVPMDIPFTAENLAGGTYSAGDVIFSVVLPGLTLEDIAGMTALTDSSFGTDAIKNQWRQYGDVDKHGEGTCLQANANSPAYISAKIAIDANKQFMKFNARMFVRDSDQRGLLQVKVIKADGSVDTLKPIRVYHGNEVLNGKVLDDGTLINSEDYYTEGVYDLTAYVGSTVVVAIIAVNDVEEVTKNIHNAINDIAFKSNSDTEFGKPAVS